MSVIVSLVLLINSPAGEHESLPTPIILETSFTNNSDQQRCKRI